MPYSSRESRSSDRIEQKIGKEAGTGFGETTHSPAYMVDLDPEQEPAEKIVLKYEWRSELCKESLAAVQKTDSGLMITNLPRSRRILRDDPDG